MRRSHLLGLLVPPLLLLLVAVATAQTTAPGGQSSSGWQDGFVLQTSDEANRLVIGAVIRFDARFSLDDPAPFISTFQLRTARPMISGRVAKYFDFKLVPDFGNGTATVSDANFDIRFSRKLRVRSGKDKTPVGYELLQSGTYLPFPDRMLSSSLVPSRDVGVQVQGDLGTRAVYAVGVFNGVPDATSSTADVDNNGEKEVAGRVLVRPFASQGTPAALRGLGLHIGGSTAQEVGALPAFRSPGGQTYFAYATGASAGGRHTRASTAAFYYFKSFGGYAEYVRSAQVVSRDGVSSDVANHAWGATGVVVLTGEPVTDRGLRPRRSFDPATRSWGALQLAVRYSRLTVDPAVFAAALGAAGTSRGAALFSVAANWYAAAMVKYSVAFQRMTFASSPFGRRPAERMVLVRAQLAF